MAESGSGGRSVGVLAAVVVALVLLCLGGTVVAGMMAAIAIPNFVAMQLKAKRSEVPGNMAGIKLALLSYDAAFDDFPMCGDERSARRGLGKELRPWAGGECWEALGWRPAGDVRGGYWIEPAVAEDGTRSFAVHGVCDVDGDGQVVEYVATRDEEPRIVSGDPEEY